MKRNLVELKYEAAQWKHKAVWTGKYMEAKRGHRLLQMWNDHEIDITRKTSNSYEVTTEDILRAASAAARKPSARLPDNKFLQTLGCPYCTSLDMVHCHLGQQKNGRDAFAKTKLSPSYTKPKQADKSSLKRWWRNAVSIVLDRPLRNYGNT